MKYLLILSLLVYTMLGHAQETTIKRFPIDPNNLPIVCKGKDGNHGHFVQPEALSRNSIMNPAVFEVEFDRNMPPTAIAAFDYVIQLLSERISSTIPIRVYVSWEELGEFTLASTGPAEFVKDFPNGPKGIAFPIALAEKIAQQPINNNREPDVYVSIDNSAEWFYDYENPSNISNTEFDYVSVMLHELMHGIAFIGFATVENSLGSIKTVSNPSDCLEDACKGPSIYDVYLHNTALGNLCDQLPDPSIELRRVLTNNDLDLLTPNLSETTALPKMYAPREFATGSSIYHLDQDTYEATPNSLMTPFIGTGEIEHGFGVSLDILYELGWGPETPNYEDFLAPFIEHAPVGNIDDKTLAFSVEAVAEDLFSDVERVYVEYFVNGVLQSTVLLNKELGDFFRENLYVGTVELNQPLAVSDVLEYRVIAVDNSAQKNTRTAPAEGLYTISIEETFDARITYINDFNLPSADFTGTDFTVETPSEFNNAAIQSQHPYPSADDGNILNFIYQLNIPIQIRTREPLIEFDEIVLVEPGEPNTVHTDAEFWDYVIVEGRKIDGIEWFPIIAGYDSSDHPDWRTAYQNGMRFNNQNSRTIGTPDLIKNRSIDMTQSGHFKSGDTVFIRFRLFSDPSLSGWGWAIDNLRIQDSSVAVEDFVSTDNFQLFPNPVTNKVITINAFLKQPVSDLQLILYNDAGQLILQQEIASKQGDIQAVINVADYPSGLYFVTIQVNGTEVVGKKVVVH